jgi:arylsulfatase
MTTPTLLRQRRAGQQRVGASAWSLVLAVAVLCSGAVWAQEVLPVPPAPFKGQIGLSAKDSKSDFPKPVQAPQGAPNVVLILLDDRLAPPPPSADRSTPRRWTDWPQRPALRNSTTAVCSPTGGTLIGRNHHWFTPVPS